MIKVYCKQPIEAEQFDGSSKMVEKYKMMDAGTMIGTQHSPELYLEGAEKVVVGDWIATGINGEHWPIADDVFKKTYAGLPVIPKAVADWIEYCKTQGLNLENAIDEFDNPIKVEEWLDDNSLELFARAWLDGYQVEAQHDTRTD
ncbi:DUF1642 domain-containing protein [Lactobacillus sp. SL9-6]|nr:DUF1642 domain-containing protein [Lactobacillus sp. SL9-6]